jgi:predicted alpha/beta hydrolase
MEVIAVDIDASDGVRLPTSNFNEETRIELVSEACRATPERAFIQMANDTSSKGVEVVQTPVRTTGRANIEHEGARPAIVFHSIARGILRSDTDEARFTEDLHHFSLR